MHQNSSSRVLYAYGEIDQKMAKELSEQIMQIGCEEPGLPVIMYINSHGGNLYDALAILNLINYFKLPLITVVNGVAFSGGAFLAMAGDKGLRFATPYSTIMVHAAQTGSYGKIPEIKNFTFAAEQINDIYVEKISQYTGKSKEVVEKDLLLDNWFSPDAAKDYGIIDHIGMVTENDFHSKVVLDLQHVVPQKKKKDLKKNGKKGHK